MVSFFTITFLAKNSNYIFTPLSTDVTTLKHVQSDNVCNFVDFKWAHVLALNVLMVQSLYLTLKDIP